ncbi:MAG: serine/threonine protein kinase [Polyangiaceae bacterium]|nr:serine/threonine protein kinase [Polyangiaceae bacterium]
MATIHLGRLRGAAGFSRIVAVKRLHARFARDKDFVAMFTDEARIASRLRHPNVVATLDVLASDDELFLVMEYIHGESLSHLISATKTAGAKVPIDVAAAILVGALRGLHEAHEARDERGRPLGVVHRDISPQNVLVGADGVARVLDFGVAKAAGQLHVSGEAALVGKFGYMPPEQLTGEELDRQADVYAAGVVLWETLTSKRLFPGKGEEVFAKILSAEVPPPSSIADDVPPALDRVVLRALSRDRGKRHATAADLGRAIEAAVPLASPSRVGAWVKELAERALDKRTAIVARIESLGEEVHVPAKSVPALRALSPDERTEDHTLFDPHPPRFTSRVPAALRRDLRPWLALVVLALSAFAVVLAVRADRAPAAAKSAAPSAEPSPSAPPSATTSAPSAVSAPAAVSAAPSATSAPEPRPTHDKPRTTPRPAPQADCNPPFVVTAAGVKRYKKECFK